MKKPLLGLGLTILIGLPTLSLLGAANGPVRWRTNFNEAMAEARKSGKLVVVNIHASWCAPCRALQATTLSDATLASFINESCIAVSLDSDQNQDLIQRWRIESVPTQLFFSPDGQRVGRIEGYTDVRGYSSSLRQAMSMVAVSRPKTSPAPKVDPGAVASRPPEPAPKSPPKIEPSNFAATAEPKRALAQPANPKEGDRVPMQPPPLANAPKSPATFVADTKPAEARPRSDNGFPLALEGFCPVSMHLKAELAAGLPDFTAIYQGKRYQFRSSENREVFRSNPEKFLPAENGQCVVTFHEQSEWRIGAIELPAIFGEHVYFFRSAEMREKFLRDPERYVDRTGRAIRNGREPLFR